MPNKKFIQIYVSAKAKELRKPENLLEFLRITNGCGPGGWKFDLVPDTIWGLSIKDECNNHDVDWHFAESWAGAMLGNTVFEKAVHYKIGQHAWILRGLRRLRFNWYMRAVYSDKAKEHFDNIKQKRSKRYE